MTRLRIGILVFDDVEVLDVCGPFEVFSVAGRAAVRAGRAAPFEVVLIAAGSPGPVQARGGLPLQLDVGLAEAPPLDVLLVPGGVTDTVLQYTEAQLADLIILGSVELTDPKSNHYLGSVSAAIAKRTQAHVLVAKNFA